MFFICSEIKDLSAKGLHNLTRCSPDYIAKEGKSILYSSHQPRSSI